MSIKLGGGMSLPYDENWCVFVSAKDNKTFIKKVDTKAQFKAYENKYGSFVYAGETKDDARDYVKSFTGPAKDFELMESADKLDTYQEIANKLFRELKPYGANQLSNEVDVMVIRFDSEITGGDSTLIEYAIEECGFTEITSFSFENDDLVRVVEFINETNSVAAKLLQYKNGNTVVEVSKEINEAAHSMKNKNKLVEKFNKDELETKLITAVDDLISKGENNIKVYEHTLQDTIEDHFSGELWWKVCKLNIFMDLFEHRDPYKTIKNIIDNIIDTETNVNLDESISSVKNILEPLIVNGKIRPFKKDEKQPRGFAFKSGNQTSGEVSYNGTDYTWAIVDGKLRVMTSDAAGSNWSETIYSNNFKEAIKNDSLVFSNYDNAKKEAEDRGFSLAEYGDVFNTDYSYSVWTKSGERGDKPEICAYYKFVRENDTFNRKPLDKFDINKLKSEMLTDKFVDFDLDESCTSDSCDYTDDGKDDVIKKYEIRMDGKFQEYITGTEQDVIDRINDYKSLDDADKQMFIMNGLDFPEYTYELVIENEATEDLKFDVDENFRIRESNRNI